MQDERLASIDRAVHARSDDDPYRWIREATEVHRRAHGCGAYPFADGSALGAVGAAVGPGTVLELGTALGYTACWWASVGAHVDTVEVDAVHARLAEENIRQAGLDSRVTVHRGRFDEVMERRRKAYDLIFFDGFAPSVGLLADMDSLLAPGGVLVLTNLDLDGGECRRVLRRCAKWRTRFLGNDLALATPGS